MLQLKIKNNYKLNINKLEQYNFNQTRYLELLDEEEILKQRSTSLYWSDEEKYKELIHYRV